MVTSQASLSLSPSLQPVPRPAPRATPVSFRELWLALHLPLLPLEIFATARATSRPAVVCESVKSLSRVVAANRSARRAGIDPGTRLSVALTLSDRLHVCQRNSEAERKQLQALALWGTRYTSRLTPAAPTTLLMEIGASLRLFGGLDRLLDEIERGIGQLGHACRLAAAPTPGAAALLARARQPCYVTQQSELGAALRRLPVDLMELDEKHRITLRRMGVDHIDQLMRLPRDDLTRRLSPAVIDQLDRLLGHRPDPRSAFTPPEHFDTGLELDTEITDTGALLPLAAQLLQRLETTLRACCAAVSSCEWRLCHPSLPPSVVPVRLVAPSRQASHWLEQTAHRLENLALPEPVRRIGLSTAPLEPFSGASLSWVRDRDRPSAESRHALLDQLRTRLGDEAVQGARLVAEHRPELAWRPCPPGESSPALEFGRRPLWLLSEPIALPTRNGRPYLEGSLYFKKRRERITSGWWDSLPVARDYFTVCNTRGKRFWIFRELHSDAWYLHGVYG